MKNNDNDKSSLLAHLAWQLSKHPERITSESLGYIMGEQCMRDAIAEFIKKDADDIGRLKSVETEVAGDKGERPDIVCFDENRKQRLIIEVKLEAELTENQPNEYFQRLPQDNKPSVLLFVCPEKRIEELWPKLTSRLKQDGEPPSKRASNIFGDSRWLMIASWRELLGYMKFHASESKNPAAECDIDQLIALCERYDDELFLPLSLDDLNPNSENRLPNFITLVDASAQRATSRKLVNRKGLSKSKGYENFYYGLYVFIGKNLDDATSNDKGWCALFGINRDWWANRKPTAPLWISFVANGTQTDLNKVRQRLQNCKDFWKEHNAIPIELPIGVEYNAVIEAVVKRFSAIADKLGDPQAD